MKKPLDQITEAYFRELDEDISDKIRSRIHWICENAKGENILDVGCSQGITSILLGREGKKVIGIDQSSEAITYAQNVLSYEEVSTKEYVNFQIGNFVNTDFGNKTFDCILFGDVLNEITDPHRFINKAVSLLNHDGLIIITVPFGVNDYFYHKKNYYVNDLLELQGKYLALKEVSFMNKWIGAVFSKTADLGRVSIDKNLLIQLENSFEMLEKQYVQESKMICLLQAEKEQIYKNNLKQQIEIDELKEKINKLSSQKSEQPVKMTNGQAEKELKAEKKVAIESIKKNIGLEEHLLAAFKKEEKLLISYKNLLRKYNALSNSKLGKLTLLYWKRRRSIFGGK